MAFSQVALHTLEPKEELQKQLLSTHKGLLSNQGWTRHLSQCLKTRILHFTTQIALVRTWCFRSLFLWELNSHKPFSQFHSAFYMIQPSRYTFRHFPEHFWWYCSSSFFRRELRADNSKTSVRTMNIFLRQGENPMIKEKNPAEELPAELPSLLPKPLCCFSGVSTLSGHPYLPCRTLRKVYTTSVADYTKISGHTEHAQQGSASSRHWT